MISDQFALRKCMINQWQSVIKFILQASLEHLWSARQRKFSLIRRGFFNDGGDLGDDKYSDDCDVYYHPNPVRYEWLMVKTVEIILQAVLSIFIDTTFLFGMAILEGKGPTASLENLKDKYNF